MSDMARWLFASACGTPHSGLLFNMQVLMAFQSPVGLTNVWQEVQATQDDVMTWTYSPNN